MIHVQIASQLTADGVHGARWVLLEAAPVSTEREPAAAAVSPTGPAEPEPDRPAPPATSADAVVDGLRLRLLKALVVALGLGAALWTAAVQIGPPGRAAAPVAPAPAASVSANPSPAAPRATVAAPAAASRGPGPAASAPAPGGVQPPAGPASADLSRLTASL